MGGLREGRDDRVRWEGGGPPGGRQQHHGQVWEDHNDVGHRERVWVRGHQWPESDRLQTSEDVGGIWRISRPGFLHTGLLQSSSLADALWLLQVLITNFNFYKLSKMQSIYCWQDNKRETINIGIKRLPVSSCTAPRHSILCNPRRTSDCTSP